MDDYCDNCLDGIVQQHTNYRHNNSILTKIIPESNGQIAHQLKSLQALHDEIMVWPLCEDTLTVELCLVSNYTSLCLSSKMIAITDVTLISSESSTLICQVLKRIQCFAYKKSSIFDDLGELSVETETKKLLQAVMDSLAHFRLKALLGKILFLCCQCCLLRIQDREKEKSKIMLDHLTQLSRMAGTAVLEENLPLKHGLLLHSLPDTEKESTEDQPCVGDVVWLVLSASKMTGPNWTIHGEQWKWLEALLVSNGLIKDGKHTQAMTLLERAISSTSVDPEQKCLLLCQFAECYALEKHLELSVQTYKKAFEVHPTNYTVLYKLASVYKSLCWDEQEIQCLARLVEMLEKRRNAQNVAEIVPDLATIIMSACDVMPSVQFQTVLLDFARRLFQLQRFNEAVKQYQALLDLLEDMNEHSKAATAQASTPDIDVREVLVETAESMALGHDYTQCIALCDECYSYLACDDTLARLSQSSSHDVDLEQSQSNTTKATNSSHHNFFNSPTKMDFGDSQDKSLSETENKSIKTPRRFLGLCSMSRKRARSADNSRMDVEVVPDENKSESSFDDVQWCKSLSLRLLQCKADALVAMQGFSDETMNCLTKAFKMITNNDLETYPGDLSSDTSRPAPAKCIKLDGSTNTDIQRTPAKSQQRKDSWVAAVVGVATRMARACLKRKQFTSLLNSCKIVLQLDPHNIDALYLQTLVLRDQGHDQLTYSRLWLEERGFDCNAGTDVLKLAVDEKSEEIRVIQADRKIQDRWWWKTNVTNLLTMDVACLNDFIQLSSSQ